MEVRCICGRNTQYDGLMYWLRVYFVTGLSVTAWLAVADLHVCVCVCESYIGKPIGTRAVPQFTTGVAKPLTQIEPGKTEHHPPV